MTNRMRPIHPGVHLKDELEERELTANAFAQAIGVTPARVGEILKVKRGITVDTALRLARYFGGTAEFWLNLQVAYDLKMAEETIAPKINKLVQPAAQSRRGTLLP